MRKQAALDQRAHQKINAQVRMRSATTDPPDIIRSANRPAEALDRLKTARQIDEDDTTQIDLTVRALEALERNDEAQDVRWRFFQKTLNPDFLRAYLKRLPDFEDFEAEQKGLTWAAGHQSAERALAFFTAWPNLEQAARLVRNRLSDLNGAVYYSNRLTVIVLSPSACNWPQRRGATSFTCLSAVALPISSGPRHECQ